MNSQNIEHLRQLRDDGKASGPLQPFDIARTIAAAQAWQEEACAE